MLKFYRSIFILAAFILLAFTSVAQVVSYNFSQSIGTGPYTEITAANPNFGTFQTGTALNTNAVSGVITLPFPFTFNCRTYTTTQILNNSFVYFGLQTSPTLTNVNAMGSTTGQRAEGLLCPFGVDIVASTVAGASPSITYGSQGANFVIQFKDIARGAANAAADRINFQVHLEPSGTIKYIYGPCTTTSTATGTVFVGMRGFHSTDFIGRNAGAASPFLNWSNSIASTANSLSMRVGTDGANVLLPATNLTFTWTPPTCANPSYQPFPAALDFENTWIDTFRKNPNIYSRTWPGRGNPNWFREDETQSNTGWDFGTNVFGAYTPSGANGTAHSARMQQITSPNYLYTDLDWHVNLSNCPSSNKELKFFYLNPIGSDSLQVLFSTNAGGSFTKIFTVKANTGWTQYTVPLNIQTSPTCILRFRATPDNTAVSAVAPDATNMGLDEITVTPVLSGISPTISTTPSGSAAVCAIGQGNNNVSITATGAVSYQWAPSAGLSATTGATVIATPTANTIYTITGTDASCNIGTTTIAVSKSLNYELVTNTTVPNICFNGSSTITANDTIFGNFAMPISVCAAPHTNATAGPCFANISLNTFNSSAAGCNLIFYKNNVGIPITTLLAGSSASLSTSLNTSVNANISVWIDYNRDGDFDVNEYTSITTSGIAGTPYIATINIPTNALPGYTRMRLRTRNATQANGAANACSSFTSGETQDFTVQIIGTNPPLTFAWSPTSFISGSSTSKNISLVNVTNTTTYTIVGTDAQGCSISSTALVTIAPLSTLTINTVSNNICAGAAATLTTAINGGGNPYSYQWIGPNSAGVNIVIGASNSIVVNPSAPTTYTCIVTDACGSSQSSTIAIGILPQPVITLSNPNGGAIQVCGTNANNTSVVAQGAVSYTWSPIPSFSTASGDSINVLLGNSTIYTVTATGSNNCTKAQTINIIYQPNYPLSIIANPLNICAGSTSTITVTDTIFGSTIPANVNYCTSNLHTSIAPIPACLDSISLNTFQSKITSICGSQNYFGVGSNAVTNLFAGQPYNLSTAIAPSGSSFAWIDYNQNGVFEISESVQIATNNNFATAGFIVPTNAIPGVTRMRIRTSTLNFNSSDACSNLTDGTTHDFLIQIVNKAPVAILSYSWTPATSINGTTTGPIIITNPLVTSTPYVVTSTDANGCTKQSAVNVVVAPLSCSSISSSQGLSFCAGAPTYLTANYTGGGTPYVFEWKDASGVIGNTSTILVNPNASTTYTVTITSGCIGNATCSNVITINPLTVPNVSVTSTAINNVICNSGSATLTANGAATYSWAAATVPSYLNATTGNVVIANPIVSTAYTVTGTAANGCTSTTFIPLTFSPTLNLAGNATPNSIGACGGSATLTVIDTMYGPQVTPVYCASTATNVAENDITYFAFNSISNISSCGATSPVAGSQAFLYNNYANLIAPKIYTGSVQNFSLVYQDCSNTTFAGGVKVFIDFNRDGDFADAYEEVYATPVAKVGGDTVNSIVTIPANAAAGKTKIRVITQNTSSPSSISSCNTYAFGETEDYEIELVRVPVAPNAFVWNPGNLSGPIQTVSPTLTTVYTVVATNTLGCTNQTTVSVNAGSLTCNPITVTSNIICVGASSTLTAQPSSGTAPFTYLWSTNATTNTLVVNPSITTTYTVIISDACGTTCSTTITVSVNNLPSVVLSSSLAPNTGICISGTATLSATTNAITPTFSWSPATFISSTSTNTVLATNPTASTTYTVNIVDGSTGCSNSNTILLPFSTVFAIRAIANPNAVCAGGNATLVATDTVNGPQSFTQVCAVVHTTATPCIDSVSFAGFTSPASNAFTCTPSSWTAAGGAAVANLYAGTTIPFNVRSTVNTSSNGAQVGVWIDYNRDGDFNDVNEFRLITSASIGGIVNSIALNIPSDAVPGNTVLRVRLRTAGGFAQANSCTQFGSGETEDYIVNIIGTSSANPIVNYVWSQGATSLGNGVTKAVNNIAATTIYSVVATNAIGCTTSTNVSVAINPFVFDSISGKAVRCQNVNDTLRVHARLGGKPYTYNWAPASAVVSTIDSIAIININANTIFTVTVSDQCGATQTRTFIANIINAPAVSASSNVVGICGAGNAQLTATGALNYLWTPNTFLTTNNAAIVSSINPTASITYTITGTASNGCVSSTTLLVPYSVALTVAAKTDAANICPGQSTNLSIIDTADAPATTLPSICASSASSSNFEDIFNVTMSNGSSSINNSSTCSAQYSNFTTTVPAPTFYSNQNINFSVNIGLCTPTTLTNGCKIFMDYNNNGSFSDPGELVYQSAILQSGANTIVGNFAIPNVVTPGDIRCRVVVAQVTNINSIGACNSYSSGETEDYTIHLVNVPTYPNTTYTWSSGTTPSTGKNVLASPNVNTIYTVTIANTIGCTAQSTVAVNVAALSIANITTLPSGNVCPGTVVNFQPSIFGAVPPLTYLWSNGKSTLNISDTITNNTTYTLTVTNGCGQTTTSVVTKNVLSLPVVTANPASTSICDNQPIALKVNCPTCVSYQWSPNNSSSDSINILPIVNTIFTVVGTDGFGCVASTLIDIKRSYPHQLAINAQPNAICYNGSTNLLVTDSTKILSISTVPSYCTPAHSNAGPCIAQVNFANVSNVSSGTCSLPSFTFYNSITPMSVIAGTTNTIQVTNGNSINANFGMWIDYNGDGTFASSEFTNIANNIAPNGVATGTILIPFNALSGSVRMRIRSDAFVNSIISNSSCSTFNSGETEDYIIQILNNNPAANMNYTWQPSANINVGGVNALTNPLTINTTFTVTATDQNGCSFQNTTTVNVNPEIQAASSLTHVACAGDPTGSISVLASGGTAPYSYSWTPTVTTAVGKPFEAISLVQGVYTVTIIDANSCSKTISFTITENPAIVASVFLSGVSCFGSANGNAYAVITGGSGVYTNNWYDDQLALLSNPVSTAGDTIYNLQAGDYLFSVIDDGGCFNQGQSFIPFTIVQPTSAVSITLDTIKNITCFGLNNGSIDVSGNGGNNTNYTYAINTGSFAAISIFNGLAPNTYTISVQDANNCIATTLVNITEPTVLSVTATSTNISCNGLNNGTITPSANGGTPTYTYLINGNAILSNYGVGTYTIEAIDANNCIATTLVNITEPTAISVAATSTNISCNGLNNGTITPSANGGTPTYTYLINGNAILSNYGVGIYTIEATDANNCIATTLVNITEPTALSVAATSTNISCNGLSDGIITPNANGGTPTYTYLINGNAILSNYGVGTYTIEATDANNCVATTLVNITEPTALSVAATSTNISCNGLSNGTITPSANGGTPTYTYLINGNAILSNYGVGTYTIEATDANNCVATTLVNITEPTLLSVAATSTNISCNGLSDGTITPSANGGTPTYTYLINGNAILSNYGVGTYTIEATDANNCVATTLVNITEPTLLSVAATSTNISCNGLSDGAITPSANGGTPTYTYLINGNAILSNYGVGTYTIEATDANNCVATTLVNITEPIALSYVVNQQITDSCVGSIALLSASSDSNLTFVWSGGVLNNQPFILTSSGSNIYTLTVSDNSCSVSTLVNLQGTNTLGNLSQAASNNISSIPGITCDTTLQIEGILNNYYDNNCGLIASVNDAFGGNNLGSVQSCVEVLPNVLTHNSQPYVPRIVSITPQQQGPANVTLYYTNDDFLKYNNFVIATNSSFPLFNTTATASLVDGQTMTICITKLKDSILGSSVIDSVFSATAIWNATFARWEVNFGVASFSTFYCHTCNPNLAPLAINEIFLSGDAEAVGNNLKWKNSKEIDLVRYDIMLSEDGTNFEKIQTILPQNSTNISLPTTYQFVHNYLQNMVYYKVIALEKSGLSISSNIIKLEKKAASDIMIFPNPVFDQLSIILNNTRKSNQISVIIYDVLGNQVHKSAFENVANKKFDIDMKGLPAGNYMVIISDGFSRQLSRVSKL